MKRVCLFLFGGATVLVPASAWAQTAPHPSYVPPAIAQPGMNLGDTSFLDAGGTPGATLELLGSASVADHSNDADGRRLTGKHGSGFAYHQLSDTRSDDVPIAGSRQRLFGMGPGLVWTAGRKAIVLANVYSEFGAENRSEGVSMRLRLLRTF